jgi:hypothetical protein
VAFWFGHWGGHLSYCECPFEAFREGVEGVRPLRGCLLNHLGHSIWVILFGSHSIWVILFGSFDLGHPIWVILFGSFDLGRSIWVVLFGSFYLGHSIWVIVLEQAASLCGVSRGECWSTWRQAQ